VSQMGAEAAAAGSRLQEAEGTGMEVFSSTRWVGCDGGRGYAAAVVVLATGSRFKRLGVPGEERLLGRGVIDCTPCDGGLFKGRVVAVCGSDDHALADALYLAGLADRVTVLTRSLDLRADAARQDRALAHPRTEVRRGKSVEAVLGSDRVEGVELSDVATGRRERLPMDGVVVRVGSEPNTTLLVDVVELDDQGWVLSRGADTSAP